MALKVFISAGEASGEFYGSQLIDALARARAARGENAEFFGMGGERMAAAGLDRIVRAEDIAVMGFSEVISHLPRIYREFRKLRQSIRDRRPDVAVLIDLPDFHFRLLREFKNLGIPVVYFVSPQLWAWKKHRIEQVRKYVGRMVVIFPFEEGYYRERGIEAEFVGHPLADLPAPTVSREQFGSANGLDPGRTWIGLLPGSRITEIEKNLPEMLKAARLLGEGFEFLLPLAPTLDDARRGRVLGLVESLASGLPIRLVDDARAALFHARASVVASGTATVEAALIGNPFVVVYRVSPMTFAIARRVVDVPHVAMANLIAGKRVAPELIQHDFTAPNIVRNLVPLLPDGPARQSMMEELGGVRRALEAPTQAGSEHTGAIERLARIVLGTVSAS
jgi:lipid-A-disaccharide synthase